VAAVDEQQGQRGGPVAGYGGGLAQYADHDVLQSGLGQGAPEGRQGVQAAGGGVDQRQVVVLPSGLILLRAAVVIDREQDGVGGPGRRPQIDRRLAAVGADLQQGPEAGVAGSPAGMVQGQTLVIGHEPLGPAGQIQQVRVHPSC
jgi:hypothetical protein